jgi:ubiquinone/menaquinone biosynthesis C-methylase UbiE
MTFKFDREIADTFQDHARAHIPDYHETIDLSIEVCKLFAPDANIIDVGVATGETITRLHKAGFHNLVGVDSSQDMLDRCPQGLARLVHSGDFPEGAYDVVLINWTLHFIKEKTAYLKDVFRSLKPNGALVLTDKTETDDIPTNFYHTFKKKNGLSGADIRKKQDSIKSIMFIDAIPWYFDTLGDIGFTKIYVANASWCFTTFVCFKQ